MSGAANRALFVVTILTGSFLLFLVQPMVARMALPRLGGAPNVWNSAMLVYQALLLAGYAYAHRLSRLPLRRQATIHLSLLVFAALTLPIALAELPPPSPGSEALWVPALLALSIGPVFLLVSAQAPLMQRWFAADPRAGEPWALYAASNLGSFAGLIAYPLLAEPLFSLKAQSWGWTLGYALLIGLIALCAWARRSAPAMPLAEADSPGEAIGWRRIALWMALAAVPSGLMLSTTTHLTTDIFAMPLLWVIPLGLYLLSFVVAFAEDRRAAQMLAGIAWVSLFSLGGLAMVSRGSSGLLAFGAGAGLLFVVCVGLHARLYDLRPAPARLTQFYLVMSAGGALGGLFTALIAPQVFDWVWEHPLLLLAAAALLPKGAFPDWRRLPGLAPEQIRVTLLALAGIAAFLLWKLTEVTEFGETGPVRLVLGGGLLFVGLLFVPWRPLAVLLLALLMFAQGGLHTLEDSRDGLRQRSYFGIYTVRDYPQRKLRMLSHGTTLHGQQSLDPTLKLMPGSYYGPGSGAGIGFANAERLFGQGARIGVVGLGTGTLACYHRPGQHWAFFEIDPAVLEYSRNGTFSYIADCAPDATIVLGDARLKLAELTSGSLDLLAIDAFSSDAIPLHLLTKEALGVYFDALQPNGVLLAHISNRYIELEPVLAAAARSRGLAASMRDDVPTGPSASLFTGSTWIAMAREPATLDRLAKTAPAFAWGPLGAPAPRAWSDDHASILPYIRWGNLMGSN